MSKLTDLIKTLQKPGVWPRPATDVEVVETHISYVLLADDFAYKIKKPVDLGFLDFSTLELRQYYCERELYLNRRLAPDLYLDVVVITGDTENPEIDGNGPVLEYAVRMRRFPSDGLLSQHIDRLKPELVDSLAIKVAAFHAEIDSTDADNPCGAPDLVYVPMQENFDLIRVLKHEPEVVAQLDHLERWAQQAHLALDGTLAARKVDGFVRECHGDMHLGNITLIDGEAVIFDGIEFSRDLRWIDTISEISFLVMDLEKQGRPELAQRFLNTYLEQNGDYDGLELLAFYKTYRALVRAKVAAIRLSQDDLEMQERASLEQDLHDYIDLAESYTQVGQPAIVITHGASGSGKSFTGRLLAMWLPAVQIRSDVERKRLAGLEPQADSGSEPWAGVYSEESTWKTYQRLLDLAEDLVAYGFITIVDATFLKQEQRQLFADMAERMLVPFVILDMQISESLLHQRVKGRAERGHGVSEADEEILDLQLETAEPLAGEELASVVVVTEDHPLSLSELRKRFSP
jgi:uncharacterized protein